MRIDEYITGLRNNNNIIISISGDKLDIVASKDDLTEEIIEEIKTKKEDILAFFDLLNSNREEIKPVSIKEHYPLSNAQRRLWVLDQLVETQGLYNIPMINEFSGLDMEAFERALFDLMERHETLRTTIHMIEGEPRQKVHSAKNFDFKVLPLKLKNDSDVNLDDLIWKESLYPLDLTDSAVRATLVEKTDGSFLFIFILHHIMTDGWSVNILKRDFLAFYQYHSSGVSHNLPNLQFHYKDYSHWQQEQLRLGKLDQSRTYWLEKLAGKVPVLSLPLDNKRGDLKNYNGASVAFNISPEIIDQITELGNKFGISMFMVLVTIVKILLHRYTNQEEIILGTPITGRNNPELENQVGFYNNVIVFSEKIQGKDTFTEALLKVSKTILEAYEHQYYPFDLLVEELNLDRDMNRNPLFDVMVSFEDATDEMGEIVEYESGDDIIVTDRGVNKFDMSYSFIKTKNGSLFVDINYDTSLFKKNKLVRMAHHLRKLISETIENVEQKIADIEFLTDEERGQIINEFNVINKDFNLDISIKELIENQVLESSLRTLAFSEDVSLTFEEINVKANRLADYLKREFNIKKGDFVGIAMSSSIDRFITVVSAIKLGAIYVPIDPEFPKDRIKYIIEDTKLQVLISDYTFVKKGLDSTADFLLIFIEDILQKSNSYSGENPNVKLSSEDTFIVLYTSGSTGKPKGVVLNNKGLVNRIQGCWKNFSFNKNDVFYQRTNFVFDVSLGEFLMPLCFGASVLITDGNYSAEILKNVQKFKITHIWSSPTFLNRFLEQDKSEIKKLTSLKYVFVSGEELHTTIVNDFYSKFKIPLINQYGPTEASIDVTAYETKKGTATVPLGKPIPNVTIYILDANNKLLPIGIPGEIGIGGVALAKGYLNKDELTRNRFVDNPYNPAYDQKIYKTGDIGYWNEKGEIEFLGRVDNQISLWGLRIELGGIESIILEHPEVREVAVVTTKNSFGNSHIIAHYVKNQQHGEILRNDEERPVSTMSNGELLSNIPFKNIPTIKNYNITSTIINLFEKSVKQNPYAIALVFEGKEITYKVLNDTAIKMGQVLKSKYGISKGDLVGILMSRSERLIISILGTLKSGATYIPIDPDYPDTRISYMLNDSSAKLVITDTENRQSIGNESFAIFIYNDIESVKTDDIQLDEDNQASVHDLCYVCYTSGSTGMPKGVMIEHHSVVDYVLTFIEYFAISRQDTVIQQSSISFDTAIEEIFPILCMGGKLVVLPNGGRDVSAIIQTINEQKVSILSTTPLVLNEINLRFNELKHYPRILISGGDALKSSQIDRLTEKAQIYNTYGPTEATVCASFALIDDINKCNIIGKPITNHNIYLLNEKMECVSLGEIGEIYISGPGLARGYLNRAKETYNQFLPNPFGAGVFYKTGDLGKWNNKGLLEFIGRNDNQVKVRGYRIEPAEVNHVIEKFDKIHSSHTSAQDDLEGNKHLIAYYITSQKFDLEELRSFLQGQLPHYMVPAHLIEIDEFPRTVNGKINNRELPLPTMLISDNNFNSELKHFLKSKIPHYMIPSSLRNLEKLPLTASGKIDRKSLEKLGHSSLEERARILPKNNTEKKILEIWKKCLKHTGISTDSNFFEVGGDSLKATQILSLIYKELHGKISLKDIFNNPTIEELSSLLLGQKEDKSLLIKLNKVQPELLDIFVIPPILGSSTIYRKLAASLNSRFNVYGLQYKGFDNETPFDESIEEMAVTFISEIKSLNKSNSVWLMGYSMGVPIAFEMAKILESMNYDVHLIFIDRGVNDNSSNNIPTTKEDIDKILETELKHWIREVNEKDINRIKRLIYWNLNLLNKYEVKGRLRSNVTAIEATNNHNPAMMDQWSNYTNGEFKHYKMDAYHYEILADHKISILTELINNSF
jgi:amino acid adenylation domain-containing protein